MPLTPCVECFRNCDVIPSDRCVEYTGPDVACLEICTGDSLYEVEAQIAEKLCAAMNGTGIDLSDIDVTCEFLTDILGTNEPTLVGLMNMLIESSCTLKELIDAINIIISSTYVFNTGCLTGTLTNRDEILQAVILKLCADDVRISLIESDYVTNANLCTLVQACLVGGGTPSTQYKLRMVPNAPIPYIGSLSNFDNTGKGLAANNFEDVYLMNGLNGTPDWRGRSPIGAINNVPGGTLDSNVDPSLPANAGLNYNLNQKVGQSSVTLSLLQSPSHTHGLSDPGHTHSTIIPHGHSYDGGPNSTVTGNGANSQQNFTYNSSTGTTGVYIQSAGGSQPHTNLSPMIATYYICYIP